MHWQSSLNQYHYFHERNSILRRESETRINKRNVRISGESKRSPRLCDRYIRRASSGIYIAISRSSKGECCSPSGYRDRYDASECKVSARKRCVCVFVFLSVRILSRHRVHTQRANWKCWKANCQLLRRFHPGLTMASNWKYRSSSRTLCAVKQDYKIHFKRGIYIRTYTGRVYYIQRRRICLREGRYALTCQKFNQSSEIRMDFRCNPEIFFAEKYLVILKKKKKIIEIAKIFFTQTPRFLQRKISSQ